MSNSRFVYVIFIRATPEKVWEGLTSPEFTKQYWAGTWHDTTWKKGASWKLMIPDGRIGDAGEIVEIDRPRRLVLKWRNEFMPDMREEGFSRCTFELEPVADTVRLTVTHEMDRPKSKLIDAVSGGWPEILSSLKSLLETGDSLEQTKRWPEGV
ncbi:MAG: SRPBCC family protein [Alphaproteobacteria bacterium]|nr:SRPBCC family protein [Alphaproteobacteria bacterium]